MIAFGFLLSSVFSSSATANVTAFLYVFASGLIGNLLLEVFMVGRGCGGEGGSGEGEGPGRCGCGGGGGGEVRDEGEAVCLMPSVMAVTNPAPPLPPPLWPCCHSPCTSPPPLPPLPLLAAESRRQVDDRSGVGTGIRAIQVPPPTATTTIQNT